MFEKKNPLIETESATRIADVANEVTDDPEFQARLASVNVLILPFKGLPNHEQPVFPAVTRDLFQYLTEHGKDKLDVEVATEDEEIEELVLHGDLIVLGILLVQQAIAPVALGLLTNYLYDKIKRKAGDPDNTTVRCELIVEDENSSRSLKYDGPASGFEKLIGAGVTRPMLGQGDQGNSTDGARS
jgi:hypothetical protein